MYIEQGRWEKLSFDARLIRELVFIQEQQIAAEDEWDDQDAIALHFVIYDGDQPIGTARLLPNLSVGRVAVLASYRNKGIGKLLMDAIIASVQREQRPFIHLSAQVHAQSFYEKLGFQVQGSVYDECGIPHVKMTLSL